MIKKFYLIVAALMLQDTVVHAALLNADEPPICVALHAAAAPEDYNPSWFKDGIARNTAEALAMSAGYKSFQYPKIFAALYTLLEDKHPLTVNDLKVLEGPMDLRALIDIVPAEFAQAGTSAGLDHSDRNSAYGEGTIIALSARRALACITATAARAKSEEDLA